MKAKTIVLIPHFNNLSGLQATLKSITHPVALAVLVVDDGSATDQLPQLDHLSKYCGENIQLIIQYNNVNLGITKTLNKGLEYIEKNCFYDYVARIDCGDIATNDRFHIQQNYLEVNPKTDLIGSWCKWFDSITKQVVFSYSPPTDHESISKNMSIRCNFIHPTVMFRFDVIKLVGKYPESFPAAEDYAFFFQITKKLKTANIPEYLTTVEFNPKGI